MDHLKKMSIDIKNIIDNHIDTTKALLNEIKSIEKICSLALETLKNGNTILLCGNGGSACNSNHFAQDLTKGTIGDGISRPRIKAVSLCNDIGFITATSNDDSYDNIFKHQLVAYANEGDGLFVISGSGNSKNLIEAVEWARLNGVETYGILGYDGGILKDKLSSYIHINLNHMEKCEGIMSIILHYVMCQLKEMIRNKHGVPKKIT